MSAQLHQVIGYVVGAIGFFTLGLATDRHAGTQPLASQIQALPAPLRSHIFDQLTHGGHANAHNEPCALHARVLVRSDLALGDVQRHYTDHPVRDASGNGLVGKVRQASGVGDLGTEWRRLHADPRVFVVDFDSSGAACAL